MADNQDKLTPSDQKALDALEQKLAEEKTAKGNPQNAETKKPTSTDSALDKNSTASAKSPASHVKKANKVAESSAKPAKTAGLWFVVVLQFILILGLAAAGYWGWLQWQAFEQQQQSLFEQQSNQVSEQQAEINQSIAANQLAKNELVEQNLNLQKALQAMHSQLELTSAQVQSNQRNLADVSGRRPADWLLAEADYLVRMAGRKLWLEHDVNTAIMMLESADSRIQDLADPSLLPLRALLAQDMQSLKQITAFSVSELALNLGALANQVDDLPLSFFKVPETVQTETQLSESVDDWQSNLSRNWNEFKANFFSVKKVTTEIKPFMSEQQQWLSKQQLKFVLLQAQTAVLHESPTLYQQKISSALALLADYFDQASPQVKLVEQQLQELQEIKLKRQYPEKLQSMALLRDVIEQRLSNRFVNGSY
ncbi:uroporphyrinogen-III C-methyltransferase [Paraglaciecola aestuariivivens]